MLDFLRFYNRTQAYKVRYEVLIKNQSQNTAVFAVVMPLPIQTKYQKIFVQPGFTSIPSGTATDKSFHNPYVWWNIDLAPGSMRTIAQEFTVCVEPRKSDVITAVMREANESVLGSLSYGNPIDGLYTADQAREQKIVDCGGFDTVLQDELQKRGVESRIVAGFWAGYEDNDMHAWLEIGNTPADPSMDYLRSRGRSKKSGGLGFVGSDRIAMSVGSFFDIEVGGKQYPVDILQNPILIPAIPGIIYEKHFYCTRA